VPAGTPSDVTAPRVGDAVKITRDETRYPSKGTWPQYRDRTGTVVEVNHDRRPHLTEYGVVFGKTRTRANGSIRGSDVVTWFKVHELRVLTPAPAPESHADGLLAAR
jgi:hypothetical protein